MDVNEAIGKLAAHSGDAPEGEGWYLACTHLGLALEQLEESEKYKDIPSWNCLIQSTAVSICKKMGAGTVGRERELAEWLEIGAKKNNDNEIMRHVGSVAKAIRDMGSE